MRGVRMFLFSLRQFSQVAYFAIVLVVTTAVTALMQWLGVRAWGGDAASACTRAALIGAWTTSAFSAGIIGFERRKGTLVYLVADAAEPLVPLALIVLSASCFGLLAFPLAWLVWALLEGSFLAFPSLLAIVLFWAGASVAALAVAGLFILTRNAIAYEGLLLVPVMLASGMLWPLTLAPAGLAWALRLLDPLAIPVELLLDATSAAHPLVSLVPLSLWLAAAGILGRQALRRAVVAGSLELV